MIEPGLNLFTGNRMEYLSNALARVISHPLPDIFQQETIIVQSRGMSRWVSLNLATDHSICANIDYAFPNEFVQRVFRSVLTDIPEASVFDPPVLTWRLMSELNRLPDDAEFDQLNNYIDSSGPSLRSYQLASLIADTFDQYLLYRPGLIHEWEANKGTGWQAWLWRILYDQYGKKHRAALMETFLAESTLIDSASAGIPDRISVFGISSLPGFHMDIFHRLSRFIQVNLFLLNPCREYWGDITSVREASRIRSRNTGFQEADLHVDNGNTLLASMGHQGREFFDLINQYPHEAYREFSVSESETLLAAIQNDICTLNTREYYSVENTDPNDGSVEIHSCHSPMREIEVLHDSILGFLSEDAGLSPADILVLTPEIEQMSPYIKAVFDTADPEIRLPYSIADRTVKNENRIAETFIALLELPVLRFTVSDIFTILENESVRQKFNIDEADFDLIRFWITETGIRWGKDGDQREELGMPLFEENSWRSGLERLLTGYAVSKEDLFVMDILPFNRIEGESALVLGRFIEYMDTLFSFATIFKVSHTLPEWKDHLTNALETFFLKGDNDLAEIAVIREEIAALLRFSELAGFSDCVDITVIKHHLQKRLDLNKSGSGFLGGGITFCEMLPMRSIPFKVICMIGMNSDKYPRQSRAAGFDLIAANPKPGDRSRRKDDRYLFLEVLISARRKLYISYTGQSIRDNSGIEPSVLVSELIDYINETYGKRDINGTELQIINHPLQAFSPRNFSGVPEYFSYSVSDFQAASILMENKKESASFFTTPLPDTEDGGRTVDLEDFCRFFRHPSRYLAEEGLGLSLVRPGITETDEEPFEIDPLARYFLGNRLVDQLVAGRELSETDRRIAKASGFIPVGERGEYHYNRIASEAASFADMALERLPDGEPGSVSVDLMIRNLKITGDVPGVYDTVYSSWRYASLKGKDIIGFWVRYLLVQAMAVKKNRSLSGLLAGTEKLKSGEKRWTAYTVEPVTNPEEYLGILVDYYKDGTSFPLNFFPESSFVYAKELLKGKGDNGRAMQMAVNRWNGGQWLSGEGEDSWYQLCFRNRDPFESPFSEIAIDLYGPFLDCSDEERA